MTYTTNELITGAYHASGVVSREFETVSGGQISDGLKWLNDILTEKRVDDGMIPYETTYNFKSQVGVEKYFIPNLIQIDTLTFFLQDVRYQMVYTARNEYFGSTRVENVDSLPNQWFFERQVGGGNLYIYFKPDRNYPVQIHGAFSLKSVELQQDLSLNTTVADLGIPTAYNNGGFSLDPGSLVVNDFDLFGVYTSVGALINYINTGVIPSVNARMIVNDFVLVSTTEPPVSINVSTNGYPPNGAIFKGTVAANQFASDLVATYNNGDEGVGATLTANAPAVLIVDGYVVNLLDRIIVVAQTDPSENGVYVLTTVGTGSVPWILTRSPNYNSSDTMVINDFFTIQNGTIGAGQTLIQNVSVEIVGFDPVTYSFFKKLTFSNFSTIQQPLYEIFNASGFDQFYTTYLRYALADRICAEYNYDTPMNVMRQLSKYESWINKKSKTLDLRLEKNSTLNNRTGLNWAQINIGRGFTVPS